MTGLPWGILVAYIVVLWALALDNSFPLCGENPQ